MKAQIKKLYKTQIILEMLELENNNKSSFIESIRP